MNATNEIFGDVIYQYSRADAFNDGVLVNLSENFPEECKIYRHPIACTAAVWSLVERATASRSHCNSAAGVIFDILYMSQRGIVARPDEQTVMFAVIITGTGRKRTHTMKAVCAPGDNMEPTITIMMPEED